MFLSKNRSSRVSDTAEFRHTFITVLQIIPEDKVINAITKLKSELASIPVPDKNNQIEAIENLRNTFSKCSKTCDAPNKNKDDIPNEFEEIDYESPRVSTTDDALSPRVTEFDATSPSKVNKRQENKIKRLSSPKEIKKTKSNFINSSPIATHTRSQANSKQNPTIMDSQIDGRSRSKTTAGYDC